MKNTISTKLFKTIAPDIVDAINKFDVKPTMHLPNVIKLESANDYSLPFKFIRKPDNDYCLFEIYVDANKEDPYFSTKIGITKTIVIKTIAEYMKNSLSINKNQL